MSSARRFALLQLAFLLGVAVQSILSRPVSLWVVAGLWCGICLVWCVRRSWLVPCAGLFVVLGILRMQLALFEQARDPLLLRADQEVVLSGVVSQEVDRRLDRQRLILTVRSAEEEGNIHGIHSRVLVTAGLYPEYTYGDVLHVQCRLRRPGTIEDFSYDSYLALSRIYTLCSNPRIDLVAHHKGSTVLAAVLGVKQFLLQRVAILMPEPQASLLAGILLGARQGIPEKLQSAFRTVGLSHIVALSGYNITIIASAAFAIFLRCGMHRRYAFWGVITLLVVFVVMAGGAASVMRATIMGVLVLLARALGRASRVRYALLFSATAMTAANPRVLLGDVGFQLSFLATIGLVSLSDVVASRLRFLPERFGIRDAAVATCAASLPTLPLLLQTFGSLSVISPLANVLVLPVLPLAMLAGFLAIALPWVGVGFAWCAWVLLTWVVGVAETLAAVPFASVPVHHVPFWVLPLAGVLLSFGVVTMMERSVKRPEGA